jgi:hypothetical protein
MLENFLKFTAKVEDEVSHWYLANGTKIETAEKMCLQFLQALGALKAQQESQKASESVHEVKEVPVEEVPEEQPQAE